MNKEELEEVALKVNTNFPIIQENFDDLWKENEGRDYRIESMEARLEQVEKQIKGVAFNSARWTAGVRVRVKAFSGDGLEEKLNEWLEDHPKAFIKDIKIATTEYLGDGGGRCIAALIVYFS